MYSSRSTKENFRLINIILTLERLQTTGTKKKLSLALLNKLFWATASRFISSQSHTHEAAHGVGPQVRFNLTIALH